MDANLTRGSLSRLPRATGLVLLALLAASALSRAVGPGAPAMAQHSDTVLLRLAEEGNLGAQVQLANHYLDGSDGFPRDPRQAARWFERAAIEGNAYAQMRLGDLYADGLGVARNLKLAADWRLKAAHRGNAEAQYRLGLMLFDGQGVPKDVLHAEYWLERASIEGHTEARQRLAALRHARAVARAGSSGRPVAEPETYEQALQFLHLLDYAEFRIEEAWYQRAPELETLAEDGDPQAQFVLGTHYLQGAYGRDRDIPRAIDWYRRAAAGGSVRAQRALARLREDGINVDQR